PAVSIPTVTNAVSGATVRLPVPATVNVGVSGFVPSAPHAELGNASNAISNPMNDMVLPPLLNQSSACGSRLGCPWGGGKCRENSNGTLTPNSSKLHPK